MGRASRLCVLLTVFFVPLAGQYAGSEKCLACHRDKYATQANTGHAKALSRAPEEARAEWAFGAGAKAITYVSQVDSDTYLEHGLSYYPVLKGLALTPGHSDWKGVRYPTFDAMATVVRCFRCHTTGPLSLGPKYDIQPSELGVRCEACHGGGEVHVEQAGGAGNIVNPKRLAAVDLNEMCGTCHRAPEKEDWTDPWKSRHQPSYLAQSTCFRKSAGMLSCITCHDPHQPLNQKTSDYNARCISCHPAVRHRAAMASQSCVQCHMPQVRASAQIQFTNHWIGIYGTNNRLVPSESRSRNIPPVVRSAKPVSAVDDQARSLISVFEQGLARRKSDSITIGWNSDARVARNATALGLFLSNTGRHAEAEAPLREALAIDGLANNSRIPADEENLAIALDQSGHHEEALQLFEKAAAGPDAEVSASCLTVLARLDPEHEVEYYSRALAAEEAAYGPGSFKVAVLLNNLALGLQARSKYKEAEPYFRRALAIQQKAFGSEHPALGSTLSNLGTLLQAMGDLPEAERLEKNAIRIFEKRLGPASAELATASTNLADVLWAKKNMVSAGKLYLRAIFIDESVYGPDNPEVAADLVNLGALRKEAGEKAAAIQALRRALVIYERSSGPNSPEAMRVKKELRDIR